MHIEQFMNIDAGGDNQSTLNNNKTKILQLYLIAQIILSVQSHNINKVSSRLTSF